MNKKQQKYTHRFIPKVDKKLQILSDALSLPPKKIILIIEFDKGVKFEVPISEISLNMKSNNFKY